MDLSAELERTLGHGPAPAPLAPLLDAGHRALARRRAATAVAAAAAVAAVGLGASLLSGGQPSAAPLDVTGSPSAPPSPPSPHPATVAPFGSASGSTGMHVRGQEVSLGEAGRVVVKPGSRVVDRVPNPLDVSPPAYSWAGAVRTQGRVTWYFLAAAPTSGAFNSVPARAAGTTLASWVDEQVAAFASDAEAEAAQPSSWSWASGQGRASPPRLTGGALHASRPHVARGSGGAGGAR